MPDGLRVGFTGHEQEDTLGLVDMRGRYYDPTQRRFLTPDPIIASPLSTQAFSPYAYVDNNPLSRIDPTGFWGESADENGFLDEGDWDLSGMDGGAGGSPAGGMSADHDDYDQGDMDFDPGEAMAGQDEEGGNDGTDDWSDSGSKQAVTRSWEMPGGIEIDGPMDEYFRDLLASAMANSPSFTAQVRHHSGTGRVVRLHTRVASRLIAFGSADVLRGPRDPEAGAVGEHTLDWADFDGAAPALENAGERTSREQLMVHEVVEAIEEFEHIGDHTLPDDYAAGWLYAHDDALRAERDFRDDVGQHGFLIQHDMLPWPSVSTSLFDFYIGVDDVEYHHDDVMQPWARP